MSCPPLDGQGDLFPRRTPQGIALYLDHAQRRLERLAPALSPAQLEDVLGEIALLQLKLDRMERHQLMLERFRRPPATTPWRSPTSPIPYSPANGAATSSTFRRPSARPGTPRATTWATPTISTAV